VKLQRDKKKEERLKRTDSYTPGGTLNLEESLRESAKRKPLSILSKQKK